MSEVILRVKVPLKHLISSPYDTENVSKRKIYGTFEKHIFRVPYIVRNWLFPYDTESYFTIVRETAPRIVREICKLPTLVTYFVLMYRVVPEEIN